VEVDVDVVLARLVGCYMIRVVSLICQALGLIVTLLLLIQQNG